MVNSIKARQRNSPLGFTKGAMRPCPRAGAGVHLWLLYAAGFYRRRGDSEQVAESSIREGVSGCGRLVSDREIGDAIAKAYNSNYIPRTPATGRSAASNPSWPEPNLEQIEAFATNGPGLADLWDSSPVRFDDEETHANEILEALFPGDPLLCFAKYIPGRCGATDHHTRHRSSWARAELWELLVPSPMSAVWGRTQSGKLSQHTLESTGPRRFLVVECDFSIYARDGVTETQYAGLIRQLAGSEDPGAITATVTDMCAAILSHLAEKAPLALAVNSGGKSVHGWFYCDGQDEQKTLKPFMRYAASLGADPATWTRSQFVRMPDGQRANGNRQSVMFFNPFIVKL